jgi:hypothetical protein
MLARDFITEGMKTMKPNPILKRIPAVLLLALLLGVMSPRTIEAQVVSARQIITLEVHELNVIDVNMEALTLTIHEADVRAGVPLPAINSDGALFWMTNGENKKITVASNNAAPRFTLKLLAVDIQQSAGVLLPEISLNDAQTKDFIVGVSRTTGRCQIRYTASTQISAGVGRETYIITYTITGG